MPFVFTRAITISLYITLSRHIRTSATINLPKALNKIPIKYRLEALKHAQKALTDYLHTTRSLPYTYAEQIGKNSTFSLSDIVSKIHYTSANFSKNLRKFLSYHPINEFEFFYESIGISHSEIHGLLPANKFFFSEDEAVLNIAFMLSEFGFPWNKLGLLYEEKSIFGKDPKELYNTLCRIKSYGFNNATVTGICFVFPRVLIEERESSDEIGALYNDLETILLDFNLMNRVEENVDSMYNICCKIKLLYDMGCEMGKVGISIGSKINIFVEYSEEDLVKKMDFFFRLGVNKEDVCWMILRCPEIISVDLETPMISILGFLKHFGLNAEELESITKCYPYLMGKNKMANLPHVMKALNLHDWFFNKMANGNHGLLGNYLINDSNKDLDEEFTEGLEKIRSSPYRVHTLLKLDLLQRIGFGENGFTLKILADLHGTSSELQERFNCLLQLGVDYSKLCKIISISPKILNQKSEIIIKKVNFLCEEMGSSIECLDVFPALLNFDLENRIKPRYRFHMWLMEMLRENGVYTMNYSIASVVATSEKNFISRVSGIHPAAPKQWFECFSNKKPKKVGKKT